MQTYELRILDEREPTPIVIMVRVGDAERARQRALSCLRKAATRQAVEVRQAGKVMFTARW